LCVGPGGVGKTTIAAAVALRAATLGRRTIVVTVDPARRLAQALGLADAKSGEVVPVLRGERGHLDALLLDSARVFDRIVRSCAANDEAARRILESRLYEATARRLGGALEYAATACVQMLHDAGDHEFIVLDTPPTANALDLLAAPRRLEALVTNPVARFAAGSGRLGARAVGFGGRFVLDGLAKIGGGDFLRELGAFVRDFAGVLEEFHRRGMDFGRIVRAPTTGTLLVTTASEFSAREARVFLDTLASQHLAIEGAVLNRVDPAVAEGIAREQLVARAQARLGRALAPDEVEALDRAYVDALRLAERTRSAWTTLREGDPGLRVWACRRRVETPEDQEALAALGDELFH
jgi:anion-transporting  ArsA/GET3 family ATPase